MTTPLEISIALHYWTRPGDYGRGTGDHNFNAPSVIQQRALMVEAGLLRKSTSDDADRDFEAGPALECYVMALCAVSWPMQVWTIPAHGPQLGEPREKWQRALAAFSPAMAEVIVNEIAKHGFTVVKA